MHYQFETIHPFLDGNGRIGRLLIVLLLLSQNCLDHPMLYLSGYFEANRREYYERLQGVRERGEVDEWLRFFCLGVKHQADDAVLRARRLVQLREDYLAVAATSRSSLGSLVGLLFENPYVTVSRVEAAADLTNQGARYLIRRAESLGWLHQDGGRGPAGRAVWVASDVLSAIRDR